MTRVVYVQAVRNNDGMNIVRRAEHDMIARATQPSRKVMKLYLQKSKIVKKFREWLVRFMDWSAAKELSCKVNRFEYVHASDEVIVFALQ